MGSKRILLLAVGCMFVGNAAPSHSAPFQNLGFEAANLPILPPGQGGGLVAIADALPGWNVLLGTAPQSHILYNQFSLGSSAFAVVSGVYSIEGQFAALFMAGVGPDGLTPQAVVLSQSGLLPSDARWLLFKGVHGRPWPTPFTVEAG